MFGFTKKSKSKSQVAQREKPAAGKSVAKEDRPKSPPKNAVNSPSKDPIRSLTADLVQEVSAYRGEILTAGAYNRLGARDKHREEIIVFSNGTVLSAKESSYLEPHKVEIRSKLQREGFRVKREFSAPRNFIQKLYIEYDKREMGARPSEETATLMQNEFSKIVEEVMELGGTDIHFVVDKFDAIIRVRVDGVMSELKRLRPVHAAEMLSAIFYMSDVSDSHYKIYENQGARISSDTSALPEGIQSLRLQFNPLPNGGRHLAVRILPTQTVGSKGELSELGYSKQHVRDIKRMRRMPFGIVTIAGPTGAGKSTTLKQALTKLMEEERHRINVLTIEDPPEYIIEGAAQFAVTNADTDEERREKFRGSISAALRSDPDVIMIGEVRDKASAHLAFEAAMTGHQVWTSVHANDAISIVDRLRQKQVDRHDLADPTLVIGLVGQRLMRKMCPHCKIPLKDALNFEDSRIIDEMTLQDLKNNIGEEHFDKIFITNENGCRYCKEGVKGRTVAAETICPDYQFMELLRKKKKHRAYDYWKSELNGVSMIDHAVMKMLAGEIDPRVVEGKVGPISRVPKDRVPHLLKMLEEETNEGDAPK